MKKKLNLITLTVNNVCNMNCPHCYLQLNKKSVSWISKELEDKILNSDFERIAFVGKEVTVDEESVKKLKLFLNKLTRKNVKASLITNGKNLNYLTKDVQEHLDFIDISFDGGEKTYEKFRRASYDELKEKIQTLYNSGYKKINALHSVHTSNLKNIDDMMSINKIISFSKIMFTPYLDSNNDGINTVGRITIEGFLKALSESEEFMNTENAVLNIDSYHLAQAKMTVPELMNIIDKYNLKEKLILHDKDLLPFGVVRVTYDEKILTPEESLSPSTYHLGLDAKDYNTINDAWKLLVKNNPQYLQAR